VDLGCPSRWSVTLKWQHITDYANSLKRREADAATGKESEAAVHNMKGYAVFNAELIDGLRAYYCPVPEPIQDSVSMNSSIEGCAAFCSL
jgi:antirestriction protein ArdC